MSNKALVAVVIGAAALLAVLFSVTGKGGLGTSFGLDGRATSTPSASGSMSSMKVEKPLFAVYGKDLEKVEIWYVPTGTQISEDEYVKVGEAAKGGSENGLDRWTYPIPEKEFLATRVFARGYGRNGSVSEQSLDLVGATEIYNAIWGSATTSVVGTSTPGRPGGELLELSLGESSSAQGLSVKLTKIINDSRCPSGVQCIHAGNLIAEIELAVGSADPESKSIDSRQPLAYKGYELRVEKIDPESPVQGTRTYKDYVLTISVRKR